MKKRLLCLILALVCVFVFTVPAYAVSSFEEYIASTNRLKGVDYNRIKQHNRQYVRVTFEIGSQKFRGSLQRGYHIDNETTDKIIKAAMLENNLNSAMLTVHQVRIAEAEKIDPAFKAQFWLEMIGQLLHGGAVMDAYQAGKKGDSGTMYLMDQVQSELISKPIGLILGNLSKGFASGFLLNGLANCAEPTAKELLKAAANDAKKQDALESAILLNLFYKRCNELLEEEAKRNDKTNWKLVANAKSQEERWFFGTPVEQKWTFHCNLMKEEDTSSPEGVYTGVMMADITHDMSTFDKDYLWRVVDEMPYLPDIHAAYPWEKFYDCWSKGSILEKHFKAEKISFFIPEDVAKLANGTEIDYASLEGNFKTKQAFWSSHPIWIVPEGVMPMVDSQGKYSFPNAQGQAATTLHLTGRMADPLSPEIYVISNNAKMWSTVDAPHLHLEHDQSQEGASGTLSINHDIFRDLAEGRIVLKAGWEGVK